MYGNSACLSEDNLPYKLIYKQNPPSWAGGLPASIQTEIQAETYTDKKKWYIAAQRRLMRILRRMTVA